MAREPEYVEIDAMPIRETAKAWGIDSGQHDKKNNPIIAWLPKSICQYDGERTFCVPEWLAIENGLV